MDIFRSAGTIWNQIRGDREEPAFQVTTASANGGITHCYDGTRILADRSIRQVGKTDLIVIPSIGLDLDEGLKRNSALLPWLKRRHAAGAEIAAICTGVSLLAHAGLLDGKPATTHWGVAEEYRARYPEVDWQPELFITDADGLYCGAGVYSALDLSLYLVERYAGRCVATQCAKALLIETPRTSQSGFSVDCKRRIHNDDKVLGIQTWLQKNYQRDFRFEDVAAGQGMSPRNFVRRFKQATGEAPLAYLHRLRVEAAKELLEQEYRTIQNVASDVGYNDVAHFRNLFKRHTGISPNAYRQRFGGH
jgi:transcriptional regulator GlxA family with amidase domain